MYRTTTLDTIALTLIGLLAAALPAAAADTLETWDAGSGDIDFYLTMDGVGRQTQSQAVVGDMLLGWGVADRLSTYLAVSLMADGTFNVGGAEMGVGLFGTPPGAWSTGC